MPWRRKPAQFLRYWTGPVDRNGDFKTVLIFCVGWDWHDISAHLKCTACGKVGWVDTRLDWGEVIDFAKGVSG
ncbi:MULTISPECIES: hypothetical protein [unclassified Bradyrhizobium]|uniref:hypothetical protein n=1 Tax=unclassified Bradyrhizobium TaxID=2631580 RepID=UPI000427C96E|nr:MULTISPECIES: hypothetical protein [unclassified Bradyrhizobium]QIG91968.1 hypothetical protein G6P99_05265 [Bradyrhizobium sp. 6(2017)]